MVSGGGWGGSSLNGEWRGGGGQYSSLNGEGWLPLRTHRFRTPMSRAECGNEKSYIPEIF